MSAVAASPRLIPPPLLFRGRLWSSDELTARALMWRDALIRRGGPAGMLALPMWVSGPGCTRGYGFPPDLVPLPGMGGWWSSPDIGQLDADGYLPIIGRTDDCVRTDAGHVVNPTVVAEALEAYPDVVEAVVVALGPRSEPLLGGLIESAGPVDEGPVRRHSVRFLPPWSRPRILEQTRALPRLPSGKPDRLACLAILERAGAAEP